MDAAFSFEMKNKIPQLIRPCQITEEKKKKEKKKKKKKKRRRENGFKDGRSSKSGPIKRKLKNNTDLTRLRLVGQTT